MNIPPVDLFSFFAGFCIALLAILIVSRIRKLQPHLKKVRESQRNKVELSDKYENERLYREYVLRKCQKSHLAAPLFSLNDVYVELKLIARPFYSNPEYILENEPIVFQQFPIAYGDSQVFADLPMPLLSLDEALGGGRNLVISNEIGCGKTTLLAHFASQILEEKCPISEFNKYLPVFIHISDLKYDKKDGSKLLIDIGENLHAEESKISVEHLAELLRYAESNSSLILLLDGLDELPPSQFDRAVEYLESIVSHHPKMRIVTTSGPYYVGRLLKIGFSQLSLQSPSDLKYLNLIKQWTNAWNHLSDTGFDVPKSDLINSLWLIQEPHHRTILENTLSIWSNLAHDHDPAKKNDLLDFLIRSTQEILSIETLIKIAKKNADSGFSGISRKELSEMIEMDPTRTIVNQNHQRSIELEGKQVEEDDHKNILGSNKLIEYLIKINILVIRNEEFFTFSNPTVFCFLIAQLDNPVNDLNWKTIITSPLDLCVLGFSQQKWGFIESWIADDDPYLHRNLLLATHFYRKNPVDKQQISLLAKRILPLVLDDTLPNSIRLSLFNLFDVDAPSFVQLLDRLKKHSSPSIRQMVAFGYGKFRNAQAVSSLHELTSDLDSMVNKAACLSLFRIFDNDSADILVDVLVNGRDDLRFFVAELLSFNIRKGYTILRELSLTGNLKCRRATIYGLRLINEAWANELLEKISTTDEQWFVRDAATHALENKWNLSHYIPSIRPSPEETSWLIKFASQQGYSIPAGVFPLEILQKLMEKGTLEEQLVSLAYLSEIPKKETIELIINLQKSDNPLREESFALYSSLMAQTK